MGQNYLKFWAKVGSRLVKPIPCDPYNPGWVNSFLVDGRGDEEFEQLLEKHAVDEIEAKPKNFYSKFCNRWMSICGVSTESRWFYEKASKFNHFKMLLFIGSSWSRWCWCSWFTGVTPCSASPSALGSGGTLDWLHRGATRESPQSSRYLPTSQIAWLKSAGKDCWKSKSHISELQNLLTPEKKLLCHDKTYTLDPT